METLFTFIYTYMETLFTFIYNIGTYILNYRNRKLYATFVHINISVLIIDYHIIIYIVI